MDVFAVDKRQLEISLTVLFEKNMKGKQNLGRFGIILVLLLAGFFTKAFSQAIEKPFIFKEGVVIVTAGDSEHYPLFANFIGSIHHHHPENLNKIAVFDLGFSEKERSDLNLMKGVQVFDVERVNPDLFVKFKTRFSEGEGKSLYTKRGKPVRGLYSWKPVVIKQALEMFPYIFYLDAGMSLKTPLDAFFEYTKQNGYLLISCDHSIGMMCTDIAKNIFSLNNSEKSWVLDRFGLQAGSQALSQSVLNNYVMPIYKLAYDINNFVDDGTAPQGFGWGRHDQLLYSIHATLLGFKIFSRFDSISVESEGKKISFVFNDSIAGTPIWFREQQE